MARDVQMLRYHQKELPGNRCSDVPRPFVVRDVLISPGRNSRQGMFRCPKKAAYGKGFSDVPGKLFVVGDIQMTPGRSLWLRDLQMSPGSSSW